MRTIIATALLATMPLVVLADVTGLWRTEANDAGAYLEVRVAPCGGDASKYCGTITKAFTKDGEDPSYAHLGRSMIENMTDDGDGTFSGGTIWDPERDKTFKSHMSLQGDELDVDGCVAFLCEGQAWQRVN